MNKAALTILGTFLVAGIAAAGYLVSVQRAAPGDTAPIEEPAAEEEPGAAAREAQKGPCVTTGCSGQVCADQEVITTCEFLPEYACYRTARCERQTSGECAWTITQELRACLDASKSL